MYDLIIVGGGPAGLTAANYAIHKQINTLLMSPDLGGKTNYQMVLPGTDSHQAIRGAEVIEKFRRELEYLDFAHALERVTVVDKKEDTFTIQTETGTQAKARSVILATGAHVRHLNVPGEADFIGRGVSYSAVSHAQLFRGKQAAVIGDAKLAFRAVAELALVAESLQLIVPPPTHGVLDTPLIKKLTNSLKMAVWEGHRVKAITGNKFANRVILEDQTGKEVYLNVDGIFIELGLLPDSESVKGLAELDSEGFVIIDNLNRTSCSGLFAAGDVTNAHTEQVLIAIGEGAKAASSAYDYLLATL